jgi:DNA (cytosine-5)-methyltransferase 1
MKIAPPFKTPGHKEVAHVATQRKHRTFIDLFAGCGGLSLGLEYAGFEPVAFTEISDDAAATYLHNRKHLENLKDRRRTNTWDLVLEADHETERDNLPTELEIPDDLDLVVGGPPCQGYSRLGIRRSYKHDRKTNPGNFLYVAMAGVIKLAQPKIFLFENVQGLLNARWGPNSTNIGEVFNDVLDSFNSITCRDYNNQGYEMGWRLIKAWHYGVPQNRPRLLLVGVRRDIAHRLNKEGGSFDLTNRPKRFLERHIRDDLEANVDTGFHPKPEIHRSRDLPTPRDVLGDLVDDNYDTLRSEYADTRNREAFRTTHYTTTKTRKDGFQREMRSLPEQPPELKNYVNGWKGYKGSKVYNHDYSYHCDEVVDRFEIIQAEGRAKGTPAENKKFSQRVLPLEWPRGGPNITVTSMPDDYVHYEQLRSLTVREWARLQTFPDWYEFKGKRTTGGTRRAGCPTDGDFSRDVPQYTQIGNAVPPFLARALGFHFADLLKRVGK